MNRIAIVFIVLCALAVGCIIVWSKSNIKQSKVLDANNTIFNYDAPVSSQKITPIMSQQQKQSDNKQQVPEVTHLIIEDILVGTGSAVKSGDQVEVNYTGTLLNGQKFDSSYDRNETFTFEVGSGQVISGWDQGLPGMKIGGKRRLIIPANLAYGDQGVGGIPPNSPLIFEIELVGIK